MAGFCFDRSFYVMQDEKPGEPTEGQLLVSHTFRHVYRFILQAMQGDTAAASALFQRYLAGELPEELLSLSRRCVQEDQKGRRTQPSAVKDHLRTPERGAAIADRQRRGTSPAHISEVPTSV
jgi:hypothetical protein